MRCLPTILLNQSSNQRPNPFPNPLPLTRTPRRTPSGATKPATARLASFFLSMLLMLSMLLIDVAPVASLQIQDRWHYTMRRPAAEWTAVEFQPNGWREGFGGFGTRDTPGARVGVTWGTRAIWMRKTFQLDSIPANPALLIHHDEDAEVYINGQLAATFKGFTTAYQVYPLEKRELLKKGANLMAVHCRQTQGGQFIDVHVVDAGAAPELPPAQRDTKPFASPLTTQWGERVTADNAWREYPRPQLRRKQWQCLNGNWDYAISPLEQRQPPSDWDGKILVPFCLESKLGGVQRLLDTTETLWYGRRFAIDSLEKSRRQWLHFEAVDYRCEVIVNGTSVGEHVGGNLPFSFDITDAAQEGDNQLIVRVHDATEQFQLRGKQTLNPRGIWYTQVSGIWQTVWLEQTAETRIADIAIQGKASGEIVVNAKLDGAREGQTLHIRVLDGDRPVAEASAAVNAEWKAQVEEPKLWSPDSPHLYDLELQVRDADGSVVDTAISYVGLRDVGKVRDADGNWRFTLNGEILFHWGPLDQGWWPDGLLTPPSDEAMQFDIQWLKSAGFNMIRKHIKVEPRRYYYHCDRLGMMLWQDHVSGGPNPRWTRLAPEPQDARWPDDQHDQFMSELAGMVDALYSHPSIVCWVPYNEAWGQHRTMAVGRWTVQRDPSRLVNIASGGNFWPVGDIVDAHAYPQPAFPNQQGGRGRFEKFVKVIGEFGGHGFAVQDHLWDEDRRNWGYGGLPKTAAEYRQRYVDSLNELDRLRRQGIAAGVYTQTTDVEGEVNGLMTYDRKVIKISAEELAKLHKRLFTALDKKPADNFPKSAFQPIKSDRKPRPVLSAHEIRQGLQRHDRALHIKAGWIRDPYITLGPDGSYYLTGTQPNEGDPRESQDPYNIGLGEESIVGDTVRVYRSKDLIEWESLGSLFSLDETHQISVRKRSPKQRRIWAPEVHWLKDRWALVHCPKFFASLAVSSGEALAGPWRHPMGSRLQPHHDPSLFQDDDGAIYLLWQNTQLVRLRSDLSDYDGQPVRIDPAGSRPGPNGAPISRIGHEGATLRKIGGKYVHLGTAWSTDQGRKGSYNLYYCTADKITGPYGPRRFAGRFLGHGTPFQDKQGRWWCTAFFNANLPPVSQDGIQERDLGENAQTINEQGVTIVPLDVRVLEDGEVYIRAKDPAYATPGPDERQSFPAPLP